MSPSIFVFAALNCEARALAGQWHLKKHPGKHPFTIYADEERVVTVSGIGKIAMAGAVAYSLAKLPPRQLPILLNLGVAGHRQLSVGSIYLADKITDGDTAKCYYPQLPFTAPCASTAVTTLSLPQNGYPEDSLYDMEASAFYEIASKFSVSELTHCLKIVSDNQDSPLKNVNEHWVEDLCQGQLKTVLTLVERLEHLRGKLNDTEPRCISDLRDRFHLTTANEVRLKALLQRWQLAADGEPLPWQTAELKSAKELMEWMERRLDNIEFYL